MSGIIKDNEGRSSGLVKSTTVAEYDDDKVQSNIALLGFKAAVNGSLAKYNLQDQIIDEYSDITGIDAGNSTNEVLVSGAYVGGTIATITHDADATGVDGDYTWYKWTDTGSTGSYETNTTQSHEYLIVGGGGSGGLNHGAGGGGGGYRAATVSLTGGNEYTVTVGAGGAARTSNSVGDDGDDSILSGTGITTITAGGGGGGGIDGTAGNAGRATSGSGGGGSHNSSGGAGNSAGFAGGGGGGASEYGSGGGGGAAEVGEAGTTTKGGTGGDGVPNDIIKTGTNVYYAGGGGGMGWTGNIGYGGNGGGGAGGQGSTGDSSVGIAGTANTGGGGGGAHTSSSGTGGSGIVILRRLTNATYGSNLTLQSTDTTASTANPDYADMVCLIEDAEGTATLNTDIKGYISEDSGSTFTQGTFVDEGSWGTNKKIIAFHDLDISAQTGSAMCYKITTHNQSEGSKETKIHATSIGWKA
jgi:hypothetical protein